MPGYRQGNEDLFKFRVMNGMGIFRTNWLLAGLVILPVSAFAQGANYNVQTMNFDMWCQEQAHLAPERCDKRTTEDNDAFEAYRAKIEQYEIPYLQAKQKQDARWTTMSCTKDPVDKSHLAEPADPVVAAAAQSIGRSAPAAALSCA